MSRIHPSASAAWWTIQGPPAALTVVILVARLCYADGRLPWFILAWYLAGTTGWWVVNRIFHALTRCAGETPRAQGCVADFKLTPSQQWEHGRRRKAIAAKVGTIASRAK